MVYFAIPFFDLIMFTSFEPTYVTVYLWQNPINSYFQDKKQCHLLLIPLELGPKYLFI